MLVSDFNYDLPEERIAKFPPAERGSTRLLVLDRATGAITDSFYRQLDEFLQPGDVIILNDTRVMRSRLFATLPDGRERELVVLEKHTGNLQKVMYRGKLHTGDLLTLKSPNNRGEISHSANMQNHAPAPAHHTGNIQNHTQTPNNHTNDLPTLTVTQILDGGIAEVRSDIPLETLAEQYGSVPLPPYLHRDATASDTERYQTVWAAQTGSAAAPTASLNMTDELLQRLHDKGIIIKHLTLHVGLGTFLPIRTDEVEGHHMHSEWFHIPEDTLAAIATAKAENHRVVAVGTTVARTLEYYAKTGLAEGEDDIFIYPGYEFQLVDALLTNFHAPKSTVLMLASAFAGWDHLHAAYDYAVQHDYNFLSYGDSMFIC